MSKETKSVNDVMEFVRAEMMRAAGRFPEKTVKIDGILDTGLSMEVRYAFGVSGAISVRLRYDGGSVFSPACETSFPSSHREGMQMIAYANLVQELTDIVVRLQVILDTFEIYKPSKT